MQTYGAGFLTQTEWRVNALDEPIRDAAGKLTFDEDGEMVTRVLAPVYGAAPTIYGTFVSSLIAIVVAVLALYAFIIGRALWIAANARDTWSRLLGGSLALTFFVYVMVNGGMISGLLPVVGVPMPLISYGGTSAVTLLAGFGLLQSIHAHRRLVAT